MRLLPLFLLFSVTIRQNQFLTETSLLPAKITTSTFYRIGSYSVDGGLWSQPLFVPGIAVSGKNYDLLIVATMHDTIYAFDANTPGSVALWSTSVGTSRSSYPSSPTLYGGESGCISTPVSDGTYVYAACSVSTPNILLAKLNLSTGAVASSVTISASVTGTGDPTGGDTVSGGILSFYPTFEIQRPSLTLANGTVYLGFGSYNDDHPWHGWLMAYNTSDLSQAGVFCATPNGYGGAIWMSGMPPAVDGSGNLYVITGNGDWDGSSNFGESLVKLSPTLSVLDWYTPSNWATLNSLDQDLGSSGPLLINNLAVFGSKDGNVHSVPANCLGHLGGTQGGCSGPQLFQPAAPTCPGDCGVYGGAVFFNGTSYGYFPNVAERVYGWALLGTTWSTASISSAVFAFPGATMSISAKGTANGIIWAVTTAASNETTKTAGTLRALSPTDLSELWNSGQRSGDTLGNAAKFVPPTIANGKVFVSTQDSKVQVFGLTSTSTIRGTSVLRGNGTLR